MAYKDGYFTYSNGRAFNPEEARYINNVGVDEHITIKADLVDDQGRFNSVSGFAGG